MTQTDCINFLLYFACEDQAVSDRFWNEKSTKKKKKKNQNFGTWKDSRISLFCASE